MMPAKPKPVRTDSGLHELHTPAATAWVCDKCGETIDKRKYSYDEAAESGYVKYDETGACDHAEQTLRVVDK